ncbi:uncharacterized protein LOC134444580, partial [Engraulis encrasicolus]
AASGSSADFTIRQVDFVHEGSYYCQYQTRVSGRDFTSSHSDSVTFSVDVPLPQPAISVSGPDGELPWGRHGPEAPRDQSFSIVCSIQSQYPGGSFHLVSDGSDEIRTELAVNNSASFFFPAADFTHEANYSCLYEVTLTGRLFTSTRTDELSMSVRELTWMEWIHTSVTSAHPIVFYCGAILGLMLLLVPIAVCILRKMNRGQEYVVNDEYWAMTTYDASFNVTENL